MWWDLVEKETSLSIDMVFSLLEYAYVLGKIGIIFIRSVQRLSSPPSYRQQGEKEGGGGRERKGNLGDKSWEEGHETDLKD